MRNLILALKSFFKKRRIFGKIKKMELDKIIPAIFLIAVLVLIFPNFLTTNSKLKLFLKNLIIWSIIVVSIVIISYFVFK